jgi:nucleotide-binding universal stress UspA family protein
MAPIKKILFPTDFSTNADHALAYAVRLAGIERGEVIVQHVVGDYFDKHPHWTTLFDVHEAQKFMDGYAEHLRKDILTKDMGDVHLRTVISKGALADEIAALAQNEMPDLVVMGSAKGVVTNKVIRVTNRPVFALSAHQPSQDEVGLRKVERILIATDFSPHSKRVIQYAFDLKRMFDSSIYMLYVIEPGHAVNWALRQGHLVHAREKMREWANNQLINLTPDEFINDPTVIRLVEEGNAGDTIATVASDVDADLTILGTHEYGALHTRLMGTTTDELLTKTTTPILAVKL